MGLIRRAAPEPEPHEDGVFDPVDVWRVLQADDDAERGALLERLAHVSAPEGRTASELLDPSPLAFGVIVMTLLAWIALPLLTWLVV